MTNTRDHDACGAILTDPVHGSPHRCFLPPHHEPDWHEDADFLWKSEPAGDMIVNKAFFQVGRLPIFPAAE